MIANYSRNEHIYNMSQILHSVSPIYDFTMPRLMVERCFRPLKITEPFDLSYDTTICLTHFSFICIK